MNNLELVNLYVKDSLIKGISGNLSCENGYFYSYKECIAKYLGKDKNGKNIYWLSDSYFNKTTTIHINHLADRLEGIVIRAELEPRVGTHFHNLKHIYQEFNVLNKKYMNAGTKKDFYKEERDKAQMNSLNYNKYILEHK